MILDSQRILSPGYPGGLGFSRMDSRGWILKDGFSKDGFSIAGGRRRGSQGAPGWALGQAAGRPAAIENPSFENPSSRIPLENPP